MIRTYIAAVSQFAVIRFKNYAPLLLTLLTVALSNGWHLPVVQGFAWVRMFHVYSEKVSAAEAIDIIISGKEPCCICDFVQSCKTENQKTWSHWQSQKSILIVNWDQAPQVIRSRMQPSENESYRYYVPVRFEERETPPPKATLV